MIYQCNRIYNIESCLKYFFVQSIGSAILLGLFYLESIYNYYITFIILRLKIGAGPFFFWFPSVCIGISWYSCYVLIIFQKVIPLIIILLFISIIVWGVVIISLIVGAIGRFNQSDLRCFIAYSSVHHLGWILISILLYDNIWILYLFIYSFVLLNVLFIFNYYDLININIISKCKNKFRLIMGILSIGGIPPILGFFLKWIVFSNLIKIDYIIILFILVISLVIFYVYFRIIYEIIIIGGILKNWLNLSKYTRLVGIDIIRIIGLLIGIIFFLYFLYKSRI